MSSIADILNQFESKRVLVVGDAMIDAYMWGEVNRMSPEAPVPIVEINKRESRLGGAANVALNIQSLELPQSFSVASEVIITEIYFLNS